MEDRVAEARSLTKEALGLEDEDVAYITAELLDELEAAAEAGDVVLDEEGEQLSGSEAERVRCVRQDWGNRLVFRPGYVLYYQGHPGPNYACGNAFRKRWNAQRGDQFNPQRLCPNRSYYYQLCRPGF